MDPIVDRKGGNATYQMVDFPEAKLKGIDVD